MGKGGERREGYLVVSGGAPGCDFGVWDAAGFEAVGAEGTEDCGGCAVEAADCPEVDGHDGSSCVFVRFEGIVYIR